MAEITWVPREKIIQAARLFATEKPSCITIVVAIEQNADSLSTCRAIAMLAAVTGNIDVPGGNLIQMPVPVGLWFNARPGAQQHPDRRAARNGVWGARSTRCSRENTASPFPHRPLITMPGRPC